MPGDIMILTATVPKWGASIRRARLDTDPLPTDLRLHPEADHFGVYDIRGKPPKPDTPLLAPRSNRPRKQIEALFDLFKSFRLGKRTDAKLTADPLNEEFVRFVETFSSVSLGREQIIDYMPMYPQGRTDEFYRHWALQHPTYILYVGLIGGEQV